MDIQPDNRPIFATQGGYAVYENGRYVWLSCIPDFLTAKPGDLIPEDWDVVAVNDAARREVEDDLMGAELRELGTSMSANDSYYYD